MKLVRPLLYGLATVLALLLLAVVVVFLPAFQTWAVRRTLAAHPEAGVTLERVAVGLNRVHIEQLRCERDGLVVTVPALDIELSLISAARRTIAIRHLVAKGWLVDLTRKPANKAGAAAPGPAATAVSATPAPVFQGLFPLLRLPVEFSLDAAELEGELVFPSAQAAAPNRAKFTLAGGQLGVGREGKFDFTAAAVLEPGRSVDVLTARGTLAIAMDTARSFSRLAAQIDAEARGTQVPQGARLAFAVSAARAAIGEDYTVQVETLGKRLLYAQATFPETGGRWTGSWKLDARDSDVTPFMLGRALPVFAATGEGRFSAATTLADFQCAGRLDATIDQLAVIRRELAALGVVRMTADFDLSQLGEATRIDRLGLTLAGQRPVLAVETLQGFELHAKTGELKVADPAKDLLHLTLQGLPLAWAQPFLPGLALTGSDVSGEFVASARNGGLAIRPQAPLALTGFGLARSGQPLLEKLDLSLTIGADYSPQGWQVDVTELQVRSGDVVALSASARAGRLAGRDQPVKVQGQGRGDLPALLAQPCAGGRMQLAGGGAQAEFAASIDGKQELHAKLTLQDLRTVSPAQPLPRIVADVRADRARDGAITVHVPITFETTSPARTSDLTLTGVVRTAAGGLTVDAGLASQFLAVEDLQLLTAPLAPVPAEPAGTPSKTEVPIWSGVTGKLTLALKSVVYGGQFALSDVGGTLRIERGAVQLDGVRAGCSEGGDLKVNAKLSFQPSEREPYGLEADSVINDFELSRLFRAVAPDKAPTIEGRFMLDSQLTARGPSIASLASRWQGKTAVSSKGGVFRGLRLNLDEMVTQLERNQSTITGVVSSIGSLLGSKGDESAQAINARAGKLGEKSRTVVEIANRFAEIKFDQLNLAVARDEQFNLRLQDFSLIAPEVRLGGTGEIRFRADQELVRQPFDLRVQASTRGRLAELLGKAGLLDGRQDNLGYAGLSAPLRIGGTLTAPDTGELRAVLLKAASASLLESLRGK